MGCGEGTKNRSRPITKNATGTGSCENKQTEPCDEGCCPVNCVMSEWFDWDLSCTVSCGEGKRSRTREIKIHADCNGKNCTEKTDDEQVCSYKCPKEDKNCKYIPQCNTTCEWQPWG